MERKESAMEEKREMPEGLSTQAGFCPYCGQGQQVRKLEGWGAEQLNRAAAETCGCPGARRMREKVASTETAKDNVRALFGAYGEDITALLCWAVGEIADENMASLSANLGDGVTAKVSVSAKGKFRVVKDIGERIVMEG
jgi:hypothetical protein